MSLAAKEVPLDLFGCSPARSRVDSPGIESAGKKGGSFRKEWHKMRVEAGQCEAN